VATFPADPKPFYVFSEGIKFKTLISELEGAQEQRRKKWATGRRTFRLEFKVLTTAEIATLFTFYIARAGSFEAFDFVNPNDSVTYQVRFLQDEMTKERFSAALFATGLEMIEANN